MTEFVIAGIEPAKPKGWFELIVDTKPPLLVDGETVYKHALRQGMTLSDELWRKMKFEADSAWLKYKGTQILSRRTISERDLRRKLSDEQRPKDVREEVISQLKKYGLLDDTQFASNFVRAQMARGGKSRLYLRKMLREKGISDEIAQNAIEKELEGFDEVAAVRKIAQKKFKTVKHLPPATAKNRVVNFLRSRGYRWDTIKKAIEGMFLDVEGPEYS